MLQQKRNLMPSLIAVVFLLVLAWPVHAISIDFSGTGVGTDITLPGGPGTQNLGISEFTVLDERATVRAERIPCWTCAGDAENISQRPDAGLGVWGGRENDEIDTWNSAEILWFETTGGANWVLDALYLTLLYDNEFLWFDEMALANVWLDGELVDTIFAVGLASGGSGGAWNYHGSMAFDRIQFLAPFDLGLSDFAVKGLEVTIPEGTITQAPEPASILLLGGGLLGLSALRRRANRQIQS